MQKRRPVLYSVHELYPTPSRAENVMVSAIDGQSHDVVSHNLQNWKWTPRQVVQSTI
jgi:hypothetical protein